MEMRKNTDDLLKLGVPIENGLEIPTGIEKYEHIFTPLLQGNYFTFFAETPEEYAGTGHAGIFDYKARKLVWEKEFFNLEQRQNGYRLFHTRPLYMSGNKLYIQDSKDNLHVLKREI